MKKILVCLCILGILVINFFAELIKFNDELYIEEEYKDVTKYYTEKKYFKND